MNNSSPSNSTMPSVPANLPALQLGIPSLDDTYGALLLGTFVGLMLFGWTAHQFYHYFCTDYGDRWWLKGLIMLVVVLEAIHSMAAIHCNYFYLVTNYFNPLALASITWSQTVLAITSGLLMVVSQTFFLCRVYIFRRKNRLFVGIVCLVAILLLAELGASLALTIYVSPGRPADNNVEAFITAAGPGIAAAADTIITIALICAVHQSRTGFAKTDTLIDRIVLYAINTGLLTGIVNMAFFICALAMPRNLVYAALGVITSKMYGITLMAALNSRRSKTNRQGVTVHTTSGDLVVLSEGAMELEGCPTRPAKPQPLSVPSFHRSTINVPYPEDTHLANSSMGLYE